MSINFLGPSLSIVGQLSAEVGTGMAAPLLRTQLILRLG